MTESAISPPTHYRPWQGSTKNMEVKMSALKEEIPGAGTNFEIERLVRIYKKAIHAGKHDLADDLRERAHEMALSVQVRSGWVAPGSNEFAAEEYEILLGWGGPSVRIYGKLDQYAEPSTAELQGQDWYKPWMRTPNQDPEEILAFAQMFWFGE
jgi:hypothetical protein